MMTPLPDLLKARGLRPADLAKLLGVHKSSVSKWSRGCIPADRILEVERATGIPRHELRPDLYEGGNT